MLPENTALLLFLIDHPKNSVVTVQKSKMNKKEAWLKSLLLEELWSKVFFLKRQTHSK
jgi:hypothetical protein